MIGQHPRAFGRIQSRLRHNVLSIYPVTILVAGIFYVRLTIVESTRLRLLVWKESALPTLLHGFDGETQRLLRDDGEAAQRRVLVRFESDEKDCLRLVAQQ